ncbi:MAG: SMP-30/gluconolactonase/LRE family protein [Chitinophagaceae bacterium]
MLHKHLLTSLSIITLISCNEAQKPVASQELFKSSAFTPPKSFTGGAEGPAVDKDGNLYAVNFSREGTIAKITADGEASIFIELPNGSIGNGIRFSRKGDMFVADYTNHNVLKVDIATKQLTVFAHDSSMNQPNDIAIDGKDRIYASDPNWKAGTGRIWRIGLDGKATVLEDKMGTTNGIEVSPDDKTLYVNESVQRKVWAYDLTPEGEIRNKRLLIEFPDFGMDGMRCDTEGNLYIARYGKGVIAKVSPAGKLLQEIALIGKKSSNVAFGGKDGRTVYITLQDEGNIESFRVDKPGREWKMIRKK